MTTNENFKAAVLREFGVEPEIDTGPNDEPRVHIKGFSIAVGETLGQAYLNAISLARRQKRRQDERARRLR